MRWAVAGSTGLVGGAFLGLVEQSSGADRAVALTRRPLRGSASYVETLIVDFEASERWPKPPELDAHFSALGTTLAVAGSQKAQFRVDHDYQVMAAQWALAGGAKTLVLVSSAGASRGSPFFYSRMKAETEEAMGALGFSRVIVLRPGILDGPRPEKRFGEAWALGVARRLPAWDLLAQARAVPVSVVARAGLQAAASAAEGRTVLEARDIFRLGALGTSSG